MLRTLNTITGWTRAISYIADRANLDGSGHATAAFVAALNTLPLAERLHILSLAAALTAGVAST